MRNQTDYDPKKFTKDAYGNLIPRESLPGAVHHSFTGWYIDREEKPHYLHKDGTWHNNTGFDSNKHLLGDGTFFDAPGTYRTRKEARDVLRRYKENS